MTPKCDTCKQKYSFITTPSPPPPAPGLPHVMVLCEYDALPDIGHACGHNLIAEVGVAAGLGVKAAMERHGGQLGKVSIYVTARIPIR